MLNITKHCGKDSKYTFVLYKSHDLHSTKVYFSFFVTLRFVKFKITKKNCNKIDDTGIVAL